MFFCLCRRKGILNQRSLVFVDTVTPHPQRAWGETSPLLPVASQKSKVWLKRDLPSSSQVQLSFWANTLRFHQCFSTELYNVRVTLTVITTAECTGLPCRCDNNEPVAGAPGDWRSKWLCPPFYSGFLYSPFTLQAWFTSVSVGIKNYYPDHCVILKNNWETDTAGCLRVSLVNALLTTCHFSWEGAGLRCNLCGPTPIL